MRKLLIIMMLLFASVLSAEEIHGRVGEAVRIHIDAPEPKIGGGDFYVVRVYPEGMYDVHEGIPDTLITFDYAGSYPIEAAVLHMVKSTCASVHIEEISRRKITIVIGE